MVLMSPKPSIGKALRLKEGRQFFFYLNSRNRTEKLSCGLVYIMEPDITFLKIRLFHQVEHA